MKGNAACVTVGPPGRSRVRNPIVGGLLVSVEVHISKESVPTDGPALGACIHDLEREGWFLESFGANDDGGITAVVTRCWRIGALPHGNAKLAMTAGADTMKEGV
jgi:hypothetical protein